jgi:uncharacterized protein involved in exopolysaccharide biosynthesis
MTLSSQSRKEGARATGLLRELGLVVRHRRVVIGILASVTVLATAYSLLTPKRYQAHASILPAEDSTGGFGGLMSLIQQLPIQGANVPGVTTTTDLLGGMLHSRRMQDPVIEEFDLLRRYGVDTMDEARIVLDERLSTGVSDEGILHVRFTDEDPEVASNVVNRMIALLDDYNINTRKTRSRLNREFVQRRLTETLRALADSEERLKAYQEEHVVALSPEQMAAAETVGQLMARKFSLEIEIEALGRSMGSDASQIVQRQYELDALDRKIEGLPELGLTAVRLYRDVKVQEQLFVFLSAQAEQARIDEQRDLPVIQVLDVASPPAIRAWPRRKLIVVVAFALASVASLLTVHVLDFVHRERDTLRRLSAAAEP